MLRHALIAIVAASTLTLAGCKDFASITELVPKLTGSYDNPVTPTNIEQVDRSFNLAVHAANRWANYCWSQPYAKITASQPGKALCTNRRQTRRTLSKYADLANTEIMKAEAYIKANPTINPISAISGAWQAVIAYKDLIPSGSN